MIAEFCVKNKKTLDPELFSKILVAPTILIPPEAALKYLSHGKTILDHQPSLQRRSIETLGYNWKRLMKLPDAKKWVLKLDPIFLTQF